MSPTNPLDPKGTINLPYTRRIVVSRADLVLAIERKGWADLTQQDLADRLVVSIPTLASWLSEDVADRRTRWGDLEPVAGRLGVPTASLLETYIGDEDFDVHKAEAILKGMDKGRRNSFIGSLFDIFRKNQDLLHLRGIIEDPDRPHRVHFADKLERQFVDEYVWLKVTAPETPSTMMMAYEFQLGPVDVWADIGLIEFHGDHATVTKFWWERETWTVPHTPGTPLPVIMWFDGLPRQFQARSDRPFGDVLTVAPMSREEGDRRISQRENIGFPVTVLHAQG